MMDDADDRDLEPNDVTTERRPLVVEVMGPAAAGKTSLVRTLCARDDRIQAGFDVPRIRWFPLVVRRVAHLLPAWLLRYRRDRWFTWNELKSMAFLDVWLRAAQRQSSTAAVATLLDHGPVYRLARLREFGPAVTKSERFQRWWHASLDGWLNTLDIVVSLDAPDTVLLRRVEERGHWYLSADRPEEEKAEFLTRFRRAFAETLETGTAAMPRFLHVRSDQRTLDEIADEVSAALGLGARGPRRQETSHR
jgi:hypothetical protein